MSARRFLAEQSSKKTHSYQHGYYVEETESVPLNKQSRDFNRQTIHTQ